MAALKTTVRPLSSSATSLAGKARCTTAGLALEKAMSLMSRKPKLAACHDCGREYGAEYGFPDLVVPVDVWKKISPTGDEGGLLCPSCMCQCAYDAGHFGWTDHMEDL